MAPPAGGRESAKQKTQTGTGRRRRRRRRGRGRCLSPANFQVAEWLNGRHLCKFLPPNRFGEIAKLHKCKPPGGTYKGWSQSQGSVALVSQAKQGFKALSSNASSFPLLPVTTNLPPLLPVAPEWGPVDAVRRFANPKGPLRLPVVAGSHQC